NKLSQEELSEAKKLINCCQNYDDTYRDPYLSNMLNFDSNMPAFFLYYEKGELVGLLTVYADDQDVEVTILLHPGHRHQGIARALYRNFEKETASYPIESVTFQTERVFLDRHPDFVSNWGLVEDEDTETWLGKDRRPYPLEKLSNLEVLLADSSYQEQISQLKFQAFSEEHESREVVDRYVAEALKDPESRLYILLKNDQVIGTCTVDLSTNKNYFYGLAISESERGNGYGSYLAKSLVNQLIEQNDKEFQIAVEDSNVGAKRLYEKIGFVKQTQVVYLNEKGARDSEVWRHSD
ncbi:MAG: GNAT family N-acetyltransferase, partial [Streptococcus sp.]|nr:GNAT family N-acetyltransferase [Streptococcus sp.]